MEPPEIPLLYTSSESHYIEAIFFIWETEKSALANFLHLLDLSSLLYYEQYNVAVRQIGSIVILQNIDFLSQVVTSGVSLTWVMDLKDH